MYQLKEYLSDELPTSKEALETGAKFTQDIERTWKRNEKIYPCEVVTYTNWNGKDFWSARVSYHSDITYEDMVKYILHNHTENESQYIDIVQGYETVTVPKNLAGWESEIVHYKFPFPLQSRDMIIWLTGKETTPGSQFVIVTLPRLMQTGRTKAFYVSVEVVTKLADGKMKWVMATTSDAGGWVPQLVQRPQISGEVAKDVPQFKRWLLRTKAKVEEEGAGQDGEDLEESIEVNPAAEAAKDDQVWI